MGQYIMLAGLEKPINA